MKVKVINYIKVKVKVIPRSIYIDNRHLGIQLLSCYYCSLFSRYGVVQVLHAKIRHSHVCIFILWPMYLLVCSSDFIYLKVGLSQAQHSLFYLCSHCNFERQTCVVTCFLVQAESYYLVSSHYFYKIFINFICLKVTK